MAKSSTCNNAMTSRGGFSLLEMSIVLLIIASIIGGGLVIFTTSLDKQRWQLTQSRMLLIQKTLVDYRRAFNRLPCPADATKLVTVANFGIEAANPSTCTGGTPAANFNNNPADYTNTVTTTTTNASNYLSTGVLAGIFIGASVSGTGISGGTTITGVSPESSGTNAAAIASAAAMASGSVALTYSYDNRFAAGGVPTKTLRLPDDYAFDGWGRRIMYSVDTSYTATDAFSSIPVTEVPTPPTRITIQDPTTANITTMAAYALVSYGQNGHGAYPRSSATRVIAVGATGNELVNCHCTAMAVDNGSAYNTFIQGPQTTTFDDMVMYATRAQLAVAGE